MLTDTACRNAKPGEKLRKIADELGLYLLVHPNGSKYWRMDYRFDGKRKTLALGVYPDVTLKDARNKRDEERRRLAAGIDPGQHRKQTNEEKRTRRANTFEAVAREWLGTKELVPNYRDKVLASLENDVFKHVGARPIAEVNAPEVLEVLRKIEARGALETLKRVRQRMSDVFLYAIATGRATSNPVQGLHKALKVQRASHRPALQARDLRDFFIRLDVVRISRPVKLALHLLVLTFVRPGELRGAQWSELDFDRGEWVIPAERDRARGLVGMKMKEPHVVPLSRQAAAVFEELQAHSGHKDLVFPNRNDHTRPISDGTLNSALRAMGYSADQVTGHGFRATATGGLLELGFKPEVIDRQLAHRERDQVFGAYSHTAQYMAERRELMQAWADYVDAVVSGAKVIPLRATA